VPVEFGIFDHITHPPGVPLDRLYEDRIELLRTADRAGFYCYHVAEHHGHNLAMAPNQLVLLAALARETENLRLGTLVSCLPLHHPLRLVEEICMVDQLSGGRLEVGVGRGVSIFEHEFFGHPVDEARDRFQETLELVVEGLTTGRIDGRGRTFYDFPEVEVSLEPFQKPYPPLWYPGKLDYAARHGLNFLSSRITREIRERYDELWEEGRDSPGRLNPHVTAPWVGSSQYLCIADTDAEAKRIAERATGILGAMVQRSSGPLPPHLQDVTGPAAFAPSQNHEHPGQEGHRFISGSPETVRDYYLEYIGEGNVNYVVVNLPYGDMTIDEARRTLDLFVDEVMPAVRGVAEPAPAASR
jgi:alkanesulfonate monooxygenase SsuD/methylene tetrahydromethanopterin reductase-like flavin-dependent oxidoreductase (luciferase family)